MLEIRGLILPGLLALVALGMVSRIWHARTELPPPDAQPQSWAFNTGTAAITPLPAMRALDPAKVALGEQLFHDPILSRDNTVACVNCHDLGSAGDDGRPRSIGVDGAQGTRNAPTVFNAALHFSQFWDGRAPTLEDQVAGPIHNPVEMASNWADVLERLGARPDYVSAFSAHFPDGITASNVAEAIAEFERSLLTHDAPFDAYLRGDVNAISTDARRGYELFLALGCTSCHQGAAVGGNMYQRFGIMGDYLSNRPGGSSDFGRYALTGREDDRHVFKVPSLRNVTLTAPYFHDGSIASLDEAIAIMARYQLGVAISDEDVRLLHAFLASLTGRYRGEALQ